MLNGKKLAEEQLNKVSGATNDTSGSDGNTKYVKDMQWIIGGNNERVENDGKEKSSLIS